MEEHERVVVATVEDEAVHLAMLRGMRDLERAERAVCGAHAAL
jgi:hypothetical protein